MNNNVWISCGGTGGHFLPGVVIGRRIEAAGGEVTYFGEGKAIELDLMRAQSVDMHRPIQGHGRLRRLLQLWQIMHRLTRTEKPACCILLGGFSSLALGLYALFCGIPFYIFEQNAIPGRVNVLLSRWARAVFLCFPDVEGRLHCRFQHLTGNPVRPLASAVDAPAVRDLLVLGGSQGAKCLNAQLPGLLPAQFIVTHICGPGRRAETEAAYAARPDLQVEILESHADVPALINGSRWVVSRAGATSIAEICAAHAALVAIPYPHAKDDHQTANARFLEQAGAAMVLRETSLAARAEELRRWLGDESLRIALKKSMGQMSLADTCAAQAWERLRREPFFAGMTRDAAPAARPQEAPVS